MTRNAPLILLTAFIFGGFTILSLWFGQHGHGFSVGFSRPLHSPFLWGIFVGLVFSYVVIATAYTGWRSYCEPVVAAVKTWAFVLQVIVALLAVFLFYYVLYNIEVVPENGTSVSQDRLSFLVSRIHKDPGGLFAVLIGTATVIGLYYTWMSLAEIKRTVSSFSDLIDRVGSMAREATPTDRLRVIAYTPAIGYLAQPLSDWNRFNAILNERETRTGLPIIELVCLRSKDLSVWHRLFIGRRTLRGDVTEHMTSLATDVSEQALDNLNKDTKRLNTDPVVHRLPWRFMPGFYLFLTRKRAIVITPLFMPFPKGAPRRKQENLPTVQMIGLETQDRAIIRDVESIFQYYKDLPSDPLAEAHTAVSCDAINEWLSDAARADPTFEILRNELINVMTERQSLLTRHTGDSTRFLEVGVNVYFKTW